MAAWATSSRACSASMSARSRDAATTSPAGRCSSAIRRPGPHPARIDGTSPNSVGLPNASPGARPISAPAAEAPVDTMNSTTP